MSNILNFIFKSKFNIKKALLYRKAYKKILDLNLFDEKFYKTQYNSTYSGNPLEHYLFEGYKKGFCPSLNFNSFKYLNQYTDVKESGLNPLVHYVLYGIKEGKSKFPSQYIIKDRIITTNKMYLTKNLDTEPLVSIVLLNRNGIYNLKRLFKNFKENTNYSNYEIIFVDNDSSDNSVEYIKSIQKDFNIKIIKNSENLSFSKANNKGVRASNGEYVLLLNNDVEPSFGWLKEMVSTFLNNDNVGAVGAKLVFPFYEDIESSNKSFKIQHSGDIFGFKKSPLIYAYNQNSLCNPFDDKVNYTKKVVAVTAAAVLIKKSIYEEVNGLDEQYIYGYEDVDFSLKLNKAGYNVLYCSSALIFHHESSTRKSNQFFINNSDRLNKKWYNYLNQNIYLDKIYNNQFFCEEPLKFLLINDDLEDKNFIKIFHELKNNKYQVEISNKKEYSYCDDSIDIIVSFTTEIPMKNIKCRSNSIKILWLIDLYKENSEYDEYDIIITNNQNICNNLKNCTNTYNVKNNDVNTFINILKNYIINKFKD